MTESEFQELQVRAACSGTTLKEFLSTEGVKYSTYNYWRKKIKAEEASQPIAPISIRKEPRMSAETDSNAIMDLPGVTLAFPNGVKAHFGLGSDRVLMEMLTRIIP
mgnify:CR=1 FL=1